MSRTSFGMNTLTIGCEIECLYPENKKRQVERIFASISTPESRHDGARVVGTDSSLNNELGYMTCELRTKIMTPKDIGEFTDIVREMAGIGVKVNSSCGGHIHIGVKQWLAKMDVPSQYAFLIRLMQNMSNIEDTIYACNGGDERKNGSYAKSVKTELRRISEISSNNRLFQDRYVGLNFTALGSLGTVEFRIFAGSVDPIRWQENIRLAMKIVSMSAQGKTFPVFGRDFEKFCKYFNVSNEIFQALRIPFRTKELAEKIKVYRVKNRRFSIEAIKMWKYFTVLLNKHVTSQTRRDEYYINIRNLFSHVTQVMISGDCRVAILNTTEGRIYRVFLAESDCLIENIDGGSYFGLSITHDSRFNDYQKYLR